ncbi:unconventional prefoldin RPB5 interactor 1 isoform X3 [Silurus meridionalis]|uniref:unconventional prefoldin RPB5 interactor 1 isoform X3 n=1 Tax=Silurus meridionalis TaxID=175797 RepID=UPI001EEB3E66|nr:unconventional prefoldin RPB5 interactor 1 isoform X3 [Silurus meridionalis]
MAGKGKLSSELPTGMDRLKEEHRKVVKDCQSQISHWRKFKNDYESLQKRLSTLPDKLSYDIMVPFGSLAFMPGKLVHTNELTVLLGDNWFTKCSSKQAQTLVEHRKKHVKSKLDDLHKVMKSFQDRAGFTEDLKRMALQDRGDFIDIREEVENVEAVTKGKHRVAHKTNSKPKEEYMVQLEEEEEEDDSMDAGSKRVLSEEELWVRLDELERLEEEQDERDRDSTDTNGEDTTSSSEEEKEADAGAKVQVNGHDKHSDFAPASHISQINGIKPQLDEEQDEEGEEEGNALPTIYFSHTVEPKKVRINTGKNTTLKFSERKEQKEQAKRKKKNGKCNGHAVHEHHKITTPADIYRVFVDVVNGEPVPRKSILKSRSRENSVCSDTSESSTADFEERRAFVNRTHSHDDATHSDTSDGITEEDSPGISLYPNGRFEAFSGTVIEKDPLPSMIPYLTITPPALPTILERKQEEVGSEVPQEPPKRVSKFKAARLQHK